MERRVNSLLDAAVCWALSDPQLTGVALVGSYARGAARADSDIDLMILVAEPKRYAEDTSWLQRFGEVASYTEEAWGPVTSLRVFYADGLEAEFSLATPAWAAVPVDAGTRRVVSDGMRILYDPDGVLNRLQDAVGTPD